MAIPFEAYDPSSAALYGINALSADNSASLDLALSARSGSSIVFAEGEFAVSSGADTVMFSITGDGSSVSGSAMAQTTLLAEFGTTSYRTLFNVAGDDVTVSDLTIDTDIPQGGNVGVFTVNADRLTLKNIHFKGNIIDNGGAASHSVYGAILGDVDARDITFDGCVFEAMSFGVLKANTATGDQFNVTFRNGRSLNCYNEAVAPNSPRGSLKSFRVSNWLFENDAGAPMSATNIMCGTASGEYVYIGGGSHFQGETWHAIHVEERCRHVEIDGVTGEVDCESFIALLDNDIGDGTFYRPEFVSIGQASAKKIGSVNATSYGINIVFDGDGITSATHISLGSGTLEGFSTGMMLAVGAGDVVSCGNRTLKDCTVGINMASWCDINFTGLICDGSTKVISVNQGGIARGLKTVGELTYSLNTGALIFYDPQFMFVPQTITGGSANTWVRLIAGVRRAKCKVVVIAVGANPNYSTEPSDVSFDGSTAATITSENALDSGAFVTAVAVAAEASSAVIAAGGTGYTLGDVLTVSGGTLASSGTAATFEVTGVSGGVVTAVTPVNRGQYGVTTTPSNPASTTGGTGTGCTLTATWRNSLFFRIFNSGSTITNGRVAVSVTGAITV